MSKHSKSAVHVTPASRVAEFGSGTFVVEGGLLMCKICNITVDHIRRQTITDHLHSKRHSQQTAKRKADTDAGITPKRQTTLAGCSERQTTAGSAKEKLIVDLVQAFMSANIPLEKLDNPQLRAFIAANVKGGGDIPQANWLREHYVPKVYGKQQVELFSKLAGRKVAIIADETSDVAGRYVVNILLQPLDAFHPDDCKAVLVNTEFLAAVSSVSIAQVIIRTLTNANIDFNNVLALVSDNAAYMKKCFTDGLLGLLPNAVHITCWAHILSLVGEEFRSAFELTDNFVGSMKAIFSKAPGRRARYLSHLRDCAAADVSMPPNPVVTRWNTWFKAALYHGEHLQYYRTFIENEIGHVGSTVQLHKLLEILKDDSALVLQAELEFLAVHCERLINTLTSLESHEFRSVGIYNTTSDMLSWLHNPGFPPVTEACEAATRNAAAKLESYVDGGKQPARDLFKAVRVFDPRQLPLLSKKLDDFQSIPNVLNAADEWQIYLDLAAKQHQVDDFDLVMFWRAVEDRLPKLTAIAKAYIALPVASVDVERSFSKYGSVLSPLRQSLSTDSLKAYCSVFYNQAVIDNCD
jgi:hypothetical protein